MNRFLRRVFGPVLGACSLALLLAGAVTGAEPGDAIRQRLAAYAQRIDPAAIDLAWPHLDSPDAALRQAARRAIERQPFADWKARALEEKNTWASIEALTALAEACPPEQAAELSPHLCEHLTTLLFEHMDAAQQLAAIRLTRLVFLRLGPVSEDERRQMLDLWWHLQPLPSAQEELRGLLRFLDTVRTRRS